MDASGDRMLEYVRRYRELMFDLLHDEVIEPVARRIVVTLINDTSSPIESSLYSHQDKDAGAVLTKAWAEIFAISKE